MSLPTYESGIFLYMIFSIRVLSFVHIDPVLILLDQYLVGIFLVKPIKYVSGWVVKWWRGDTFYNPNWVSVCFLICISDLHDISKLPPALRWDRKAWCSWWWVIFHLLHQVRLLYSYFHWSFYVECLCYEKSSGHISK